MSSRVRPRFFAMRSAPTNWSGMSSVQVGGRKEPGPFMTFEPRANRLIASTPQAIPAVDRTVTDQCRDKMVGLL